QGALGLIRERPRRPVGRLGSSGQGTAAPRWRLAAIYKEGGFLPPRRLRIMAQTMAYPASAEGADDWKVIALVGTAHAGSHFFQLVIPSLYVTMGPAFGLDFTRLGFMMSVFFVLSAIGQAGSG